MFFRIPGLRDDFFKRGFTIAVLKRPEKGPELRKSLVMDVKWRTRWDFYLVL